MPHKHILMLEVFFLYIGTEPLPNPIKLKLTKPNIVTNFSNLQQRWNDLIQFKKYINKYI